MTYKQLIKTDAEKLQAMLAAATAKTTAANYMVRCAATAKAEAIRRELARRAA